MIKTKLKIRLYGDPSLRKKSTPVKEVGSAERLLIQSMLETMYEQKGIGLAAPQVGINQRIFVMDIGQGPVIVVNPIIAKKLGSNVMEEGCLSIPGVTVQVKRPERIVVKYRDERGQLVEMAYQGLMARVILHETDHLNGKLIVDYLNFKERRALKDTLKQIKEGKVG